MAEVRQSSERARSSSLCPSGAKGAAGIAETGASSSPARFQNLRSAAISVAEGCGCARDWTVAIGVAAANWLAGTQDAAAIKPGTATTSRRLDQLTFIAPLPTAIINPVYRRDVINRL